MPNLTPAQWKRRRDAYFRIRDAANRGAIGELSKWDVYGTAFDEVDAGTLPLSMAVEALLPFASPAVSLMRRRQFLGMRDR